jgi:hypothetical protein
MRWVAEAVLALSPNPAGFSAPELACQVWSLGEPAASHYGRHQASYDLKKFRGKQVVQRLPRKQRYQPLPQGSRCWRLCWFSVTKSSSQCWPLPSKLGRHAELRTQPAWTITMKPCVSVCRAYSTNSVSRHEHEKQFFQVLSLSA